MKRRGQAAMEFLMTYGWAILAAIIAIGVLAFFGFANPGQFIGSSASVIAPFFLDGWNVQVALPGGGQGIRLDIQNNGGESVTVTQIQVLDVTSGSYDDTVGCTISPAQSIVAGSNFVFEVTCDQDQGGVGTNLLVLGDSFKGRIVISYTGSSIVVQQSTGSITDTVVA